MKKESKVNTINLRQKAEDLHKNEKKKQTSALSEHDHLKLIHELEVHQIELELQNDELIRANEEAKLATDKYTELYDFAPSGYFTLSKEGIIIELNLNGAKMLCKDRSLLIGKIFGIYINDKFKLIFRQFLEKIFESKIKESCEISIINNDNEAAYFYLTGIADQSKEYCFVTMIDISERIKNEKALIKSEKKYKNLVWDMNVGLLIQGSKAEILLSNTKALELLGITEDQLLGKTSFDPDWNVIHEDGTPFPGPTHPVPQAIALRVSIENVIMGVYRPSTADRVWLLVSAEPQLNDDGTIEQVVCSFIDISKRKKAEELLHENETRINDIIYSIGDWVWEVDMNGVYTYSSNKGNELIGYSSEEIIGKTPFDFMLEEEVLKIAPIFKDILAKEETIKDLENWNIKKNGEKICLLTNGVPIKDKEGKLIGYRGVDKDITNRKNLEHTLIEAKLKAEESDRNYKLIFNSTNTANSIFDKDCNLVLQNNLSQEYLGLGVEGGIGKSAIEIFGKSGKIVYERMRSVLNTGSPEVFESEFDFPTGKNWFRSTYYPILDENNVVNSIQVISQNITEIKRTQQELIAAKEKAEESDRLKSAFLANMSHEIRTPMNGILGFANLLKEPHLSDEKQQEFIKIIERSGQRMLNIINDIICISKIEANLTEEHIEETDINDQIDYIYTFFKPETEQKGIHLSANKTLSSDKAIIITDKEKVYAILTNLVKNAIKFTDNGSIELGYYLKEGFLHYYVKDSGVGIPNDRIGAIFERFIKADIDDKRAFQGAGLGLAISKAYVEILGGKLWVESELGVGSTFNFTIPYTIKQDIIDSTKVKSYILSKDTNKLKKLKILIVEDDETSEMILSIFMNKYCREELTTRNGLQAIEICKNNPDIDLILMDIQLLGINGYEATKQIRLFNSEVIIIAQTAYMLKGDKEKALQAGCNDYISKPIEHNLLEEVIQKYF